MAMASRGYYLAPIIGAGTWRDPLRGKWTDERAAGGLASTMTFGRVALCALDGEPELFSDIAADPACWWIGTDAALDTQLSSATWIGRASQYLEARGVPADWIDLSRSMREVVYWLACLAMLPQRYRFVVGTDLQQSIERHAALDTTWDKVPRGLRDEYVATFDTHERFGRRKAVRPNFDDRWRFRDVLKYVAQQFAGQPMYVGSQNMLGVVRDIQSSIRGAYGDNRQEQVTDAFTSSISSNWSNGEGDYTNMVWNAANGGVVQGVDADTFAAMRYNAIAPANDQYSTVVVDTLSAADENAMGSRVRCAAGTNESAYVGAINTMSSQPKYAIIEHNASLGFSSLASTGTGGALSSGHTITTEAEGTTIRMGTAEGGADTQRLTTTDNTLASGSWGVWLLFLTQAARARIAAAALGIIDGASVELEPNSALHGHAAESVALTQANVLAVQGAAHGHVADSPALTQASLLVVQGATHSHSAQSVVLSVAVSVDVNDAAHAHTAGSPTLTQANVLAANGASHAHTAGSPTLSQSVNLETDDASHAHAAGSPALTQASQLAVQGAVHAHTAGSPALVQANVLVAANAQHSHSVDNVSLSTAGMLAVANAIHSHGVDNVALTQAHVLTVASALHAHAATSIVLQQASALAVDSATHGHTAETPELSFADILSVASSVHEHMADTIELTQAHVLVVSSALHAHLAGSVTIHVPGGIPSERRLFVVETPNRTFVVTRGNRVFQA